MSTVSDIKAAPPQAVIDHFSKLLSMETDCWDVSYAMQNGEQDFVLLHVVGTPDVFARKHIPGAIHLRHAQMTAERLAPWPMETLFVVYCAGPHCNGADRAALALGRLGRPVKIMLGGMTGWEDEGFDFASSEVDVPARATA